MLREIGTLLWERKDFFAGLILEHLQISLLAIGIAIIIGGLFGLFISEFQKAAKPTLGLVNFLYTIPSISMLGFLIPFSGVGNATAVIALTVYALLPMVRNTYTGMTNVDPAILEAAKGMGSTRMQILFRIRLPLAMPVIMSGIRSMVTMTIALAGIASFIGAGGLGVAIYRGITTNQAAMTMAGSLLTALLALVMDFLFGFIERRMTKRSARAKRTNRILGLAALILLLVFVLAAALRQGQRETLHIATKPMTEQYILGEMLDILIEQDTDLEVELTQGVGGGTSNIWPAMESGEFDLYPEYTGTAWNMVLKREGLYTEELFAEMEQEYEDAYSMQWVGMYGFNNTYGLVVRREIAEQYGLKTYSDLAAVSDQLIFGAEYDFFEREDGYDALCETYGLSFKETMDLDIGLKYQALNQGRIDVMVVFTTDGQLSASDVTVLEDDKQFYPSYLCGNIIRSEVIEEHPELTGVFEKVSGLISDSDMAQMNYQVETEGREPRDVAEEFLGTHGLLE
ncbi:MAG TPA: ABC transporter permease subunit [Candidatus Merdisoma merdipullorum]|nr:ABC transporter permease subunit [Candidatus Merdisoma merdipullorum]